MLRKVWSLPLPREALSWYTGPGEMPLKLGAGRFIVPNEIAGTPSHTVDLML